MSDSAKRIWSELEAAEAAASSLASINALNRLYDQGGYACARDIATLVHRLLTGELNRATSRKTLRFKSYSFQQNPRNILMQCLVLQARIENLPLDHPKRASVEHVPIFDHFQVGNPARSITFAEWWNEPVLIFGASRTIGISASEADHIPFAKRTRFSRFELIKIYRNRLGAHYDLSIDPDIEKLEDRILRSYEIAVVAADGVRYSTSQNPEAFHFRNSMGPAMIRHIAFELGETQKQWSFLRSEGDR